VALRAFGWDDGFLVLAWASITVHMTFILLGELHFVEIERQE
jgi:hypothetical protein